MQYRNSLYTSFFFHPSYNAYVIQTREFVRRRFQSIQSISTRKIYFSHKFYLEFIWNNLFIFTQMHKKPIINRTVLPLFCFVTALEMKGDWLIAHQKKYIRPFSISSSSRAQLSTLLTNGQNKSQKFPHKQKSQFLLPAWVHWLSYFIR